MIYKTKQKDYFWRQNYNSFTIILILLYYLKKLRLNTYCKQVLTLSSKQKNKRKQNTPEPLYNTVRYNTVLDITRLKFGPQLAILDSISYINYALYSRHNTVLIANIEIDMDSNNRVIKRLWCIKQFYIQWATNPYTECLLAGPDSEGLKKKHHVLKYAQSKWSLAFSQTGLGKSCRSTSDGAIWSGSTLFGILSASFGYITAW